jgi:hypothetical protein
MHIDTVAIGPVDQALGYGDRNVRPVVTVEVAQSAGSARRGEGREKATRSPKIAAILSLGRPRE